MRSYTAGTKYSHAEKNGLERYPGASELGVGVWRSWWLERRSREVKNPEEVLHRGQEQSWLGDRGKAGWTARPACSPALRPRRLAFLPAGTWAPENWSLPFPPESVSGFHAALMRMALAWGGGQGEMGRPPMLSSRGEDGGGSDKGAGA